MKGDGFKLTNPAEGVAFDFFLNGPIQIAWTVPGANEGWLVLPPTDGKITNGTQMFGNLTPQPPSSDPNGFEALAVYDDPGNGGNGDGVIDARDAVFTRLRIWKDSNHNGISEPWELVTLQDAGIESISLSYSESGYVDKWGNRFRYRARVSFKNGADKWAYDVILQFSGTSATTAQRRNAPVDDAILRAQSRGLESFEGSLIFSSMLGDTVPSRDRHTLIDRLGDSTTKFDVKEDQGKNTKSLRREDGGMPN
jgi:hypothetical protein